MSDSENDLLPSNVYAYQNMSTTVCAKGPNVNSTNISSLSFRNNVLTSTMQMPRNFMRQQYTEPSFDQRSMYSRNRRDTSPMSMYSGSDMRPRNYHQSFYPGGMSSQRSLYNGRSGSPMSVRSIDSNASVSAADIAMAFKNVKFNKHDLRMIKDAYNKFMKQRVRKKIEKRRNLRLFLKGYRRKSGYDSGEQGSDSSISSDGCQSRNSAMYRDNMSSCRSTRTDITDFRRTIKESNMYKDCTDSFKQNAFKNMFSVAPGGAGQQFNGHNTLQNSMENHQTLSQKERFKSGFLLPSQRFNKSMASVAIPEKDKISIQPSWNPRKVQEKDANHKKSNVESDSDQEEIFSEITVREKSTHNYETRYNKVTDHGKRSLALEDNHVIPNSKRTKLSSPVKRSNVNNKPNTPLSKASTKSNNVLKENNMSNPKTCEKVDDFQFVKPQFPVRKSGTGKYKEKLISKSAVPLTDAIIPSANLATKETVLEQHYPQNVPLPSEAANNNEKSLEAQSETNQTSASDMSMRPSFIKRKLFTQKMDLTEKKNLSGEALNVNSPQTNVYSAIQREKNKARKLVTNQSCLNRDVLQEDNNLLDLIHKIVPPDRMNVTNVTNKTSLSCKNNTDDNKNIDDDKWDVTSIISTCNNDDVSDTYTDEEIFDNNNKKKKVKRVSNSKKDKIADTERPLNDCRIVVEKFPIPKEVTKTIAEANKIATQNKVNEPIKKSVYNCVKSFWDTDFESDMESPGPKRLKTNLNEQPIKSISHSDKNIRSNKTLDVHNVTSVSEISKSKITLPINTTRQLQKYNINRNLTIKAFMTPKLLTCTKEDKPVANNSNKPKPIAFTESPTPTPKPVKNNKNKSKVTTEKTTANKIDKNNLNKKESNNKQGQDKSVTKTSKKIEPNKSKQSQNIKPTNDKKKESVAAKQKPQTKKVNNGKPTADQNKTSTKSNKPKNVETTLNTSIASRLSRTPKMSFVTPKRGQDIRIPSERITRSSEKLTRSAERITRSSQKKQPHNKSEKVVTKSKDVNNISKKITNKHNASRTGRNAKK